MLVLREVAPWEGVSTPTAAHGEVDVDEHGDLYVHLQVSRNIPFSRSISFPWSGGRAHTSVPNDPIAPVAHYVDKVRTPQKKRESLEHLARETANAVAERDRGRLREITNWLYEAAQSNKERLDVLQERIQEELKTYDRLVIQGQISNTGGSPFSVLNDGKLFVETQGHPYTEGEGENRTQSYYDTDTQISIMMPNYKGRYDVPVSIEPGETYRFTAVSTERIEQMEHSRVLLDIFGAGESSATWGRG